MTPDKALVRDRFGRSLAGYDGEAAVQRGMAVGLVEEILNHGGDGFDSALEIGCGTGLLSRELARRLHIRKFVANDLVAECGPRVEDAVEQMAGAAFGFHPGDIERIDLPPAAFDLVASNAVFHWLDDPAGLLDRLADTLRSGGLLAFTTFGPDNLREVAAVGGKGLDYRSIDEVAALVERRFSILHRRENREVLRFSSPRRVLEHLRCTGANGLERAGWTRGVLRAFEGEYRERFGADDGVTLTYHPMSFVARRKDEGLAESRHPGESRGPEGGDVPNDRDK
jgi:malonyl-CoA O-methyltransferase